MTSKFSIPDSVTEFYETHGAEFSATRRNVWSIMKYIAKAVHPGETLIDVGAGNSRLAMFLSPDVRYVGVEPSSTLRAEAGRMCAGRSFVDIRSGGFPELPVKDGEADVVACIAVLHHIAGRDAQRRAIKELARIAKPGALLILTVWNLRSKKFFRLRTWLAAWLRLPLANGGCAGDVMIPWRAGQVSADRYVHAFTRSELRSLVDGTGWHILREEMWDGHGPVRSVLDAGNLVLIATKTAPAQQSDAGA